MLRQAQLSNTDISHYHILSQLGMGGMGEVYLAHDTKLDRRVALKILPEAVASDQQRMRRFVQEAKATSALNHPNIVTIHEIDRADSISFISTEFIDGETLRQRIRKAPMKLGEVLDVAIQVASALNAAHAAGIIHRDIKPENIMIRHDGIVKVLDFGLAKLTAAQAAAVDTDAATKTLLRTDPKIVVGTTAYMSPEQARGPEVDGRTDIFSLGVVLYEMLAGRSPFAGDTTSDVIAAILTIEPALPSSYNPAIPAELDRLVSKTLTKDRAERYQSAQGLLTDLRQLQRHLEFTAETELEFGVTRPIAVSAQAAMRIPSIAVLPFADMSEQKGQEYFSDGLAEEIINALTHLDGLHVTARTSAFQFRGKELDIREVGKQLNVSAVLEGSVRKMGNRLRVTAQLISVADGYHLWSERFDRNFRDVFTVQDEIAMAVVEKLKIKLLQGEKERITKRYTQDEEAYQLYLRGRYHWNKRVPRAMLKAVECFQQASEREPRYVLPYVGIADVFNMLGEFGFMVPRDAYLKSRALLQKAQEIDDSVAELYISLGLITYCYEWDLPAAERHLRRSLELNPQNWYAHATRGEILAVQGRWEEALEEASKAMELDPLSSMAHAFYGLVLVGLGRSDEGRKELLRTIAMEPDQPMFHYWTGMFDLAHPVNLEKAIGHLKKAFDLGVSPACGYLGVAYALAGRKEEALNCLAQLESIEKERFIPFPMNLLFYVKPDLWHFRSLKRKYVPSYLKGIIYGALKREEEALAQFEKSVEAREYLLPAFFGFAERCPWMSELMNRPRFQALRAKIKMF